MLFCKKTLDIKDGEASKSVELQADAIVNIWNDCGGVS